MSDHTLLIEKAAAWLRGKKCVAIITDMTCGASTETADVIGWDARGHSTLVEVKVSRSDFRADRFKPHRVEPGRGMGFRRYYCTPPGLLSVADLPKGWGLLEWSGKRMAVIQECSDGMPGPTWDMAGQRSELALLITALRRVGATCPKGISVRPYTFETSGRATLGTATPDQPA